MTGNSTKILAGIGCLCGLGVGSMGGSERLEEIRRFFAEEARQGVAVDERYVYVISDRQIGKYEKGTGERVGLWKGQEDGPIIHLDSGVVAHGKLYCAHSNYPEVPMRSSVEIWDVETLQHVGSHSFGIRRGSCTWVDHYDGRWWVAFAHYDKWKSKTGRGTEWTSLVAFDDQWRELAAWVLPEEVLQRMRPMSNSGGSWGPDGLLYCTGHDRPEVYVLQLPRMGSVLELVRIIPITLLGQGIAWDRSSPDMLYGIRKQDKQVIVSRLVSGVRDSSWAPFPSRLRSAAENHYARPHSPRTNADAVGYHGRRPIRSGRRASR